MDCGVDEWIQNVTCKYRKTKRLLQFDSGYFQSYQRLFCFLDKTILFILGCLTSREEPSHLFPFYTLNKAVLNRFQRLSTRLAQRGTEDSQHGGNRWLADGGGGRAVSTINATINSLSNSLPEPAAFKISSPTANVKFPLALRFLLFVQPLSSLGLLVAKSPSDAPFPPERADYGDNDEELNGFDSPVSIVRHAERDPTKGNNVVHKSVSAVFSLNTTQFPLSITNY